ncbi:MAG: hypothetical protein ACX98W_10660 [bacterium]
MDDLRANLIATALAWQARYGVAPPITSPLSELDASRLLGMPDSEYSAYMSDKTAVAAGFDLEWRGSRYQVKANRPSGKPGSRVTMVPKAKNYDWDFLVWILYETDYSIAEAWQWDRASYMLEFDGKSRLSPDDYRRGKRLA